MRRAEAALADRSFFMPAGVDPHPLVFTTEAARKGYRKRHVFKDTELDVWRANEPLVHGD